MKGRKFKTKLHNALLWTVTLLMGAMSIASMIAYAFGEPTWAKVILCLGGLTWCAIFAYVNFEE